MALQVSINTHGRYRGPPSKPTLQGGKQIPAAFGFAALRCIPVKLYAPLTTRQLSV